MAEILIGDRTERVCPTCGLSPCAESPECNNQYVRQETKYVMVPLGDELGEGADVYDEDLFDTRYERKGTVGKGRRLGLG